MQPDPNIPPVQKGTQAGIVPPPLPGVDLSAAGAPPPLGAAPPALPAQAARGSSAIPQLVAILLSLCFGLFLADAVVSLMDDSLSLFFGIHFLAAIRGLVFFFTALAAIGVYLLMGLTPMIPKRHFLPVTLFNPGAALLAIPVLIFFHHRIQEAAWIGSFCQVLFGLFILRRIQGGFKFRWPMVTREQLENRLFSWRNLAVFALVNVFLIPPAVMVYLFFCASLAVGHFSEGFIALHPSGLTVQARTYVRHDGKMIQLFPMSHVAESDFYGKIAQSFPTNSIILMEGVTDAKNLITNKISYKRLASSLGLAEQHEKFTPAGGKTVRADVDVEQFSKSTIEFLNLVMLVHAKGVNAENILELAQYAPPPDFEERLFDDLLEKRNQHLMEEIKARLPQSDNIMVPWGAAHIPGIAREIQKSGFRLNERREYVVIRFHFGGKEGDHGKPK